MSIIKFCNNKCCSFEIKNYTKIDFIPISKKKAGVFIFDIQNNKVLLVQSRGNLWGCPKGSVEPNETIKACALREVLEETGIILDENEISVNHQFIYGDSHYFYLEKNEISVNHQVTYGDSHYFYLEKNEIPVTLNTPMIGNDATGIGWFKIDCLQELVKNNIITFNFHCKLLLEFYLKIKF